LAGLRTISLDLGEFVEDLRKKLTGKERQPEAGRKQGGESRTRVWNFDFLWPDLPGFSRIARSKTET
jgi:hypothetical protein